MHKLQFVGIDDPLLKWIGVFLTDRKMRVVFDGAVSGSVAVASGLTQGSIPRPLLFLVLIKLVCSGFTCKYFLCVDDLKVFSCLNEGEPKLSVCDLQDDLDHFLPEAAYGI